MKSVNVSTHSPMGPPLPPRPILPPILDVRIRPRYTTRPTFSYYPQPAASTLIHMLQPGNADPSVTRCNACLRSLQDLVKQSFELVVRESPECAALMNAPTFSPSCLSNLSVRLRMPEHSLIRASDGRCASCATAVAQLKVDALEHVRSCILSLPSSKPFRGFQRAQTWTRFRFPIRSDTESRTCDQSETNAM
ncbi:hypothetical protein FBUS_03475 [Fasciolopsis buskii]|uniref:Kinesin-like protein KIF26A/B helical domain-containing protein n=1 Tax=Fasciolopsis buskii TaxID=27845 RepID=A0A8E0S1M6_9TREM|nr:hypothetical protein FBUS_03475 [Fasciolopsis buski]